MTGTPRWQIELECMQRVYLELRRLDQTEQDRALEWALARLAFERAAHNTATEKEGQTT